MGIDDDIFLKTFNIRAFHRKQETLEGYVRETFAKTRDIHISFENALPQQIDQTIH